MPISPEATALVALTALPRDLAAYSGQPAPDYRTLYSKALNGRFPAQQVNSRWYFQRADLPQIAMSLGIAAASTKRPKLADRKLSQAA